MIGLGTNMVMGSKKDDTGGKYLLITDWVETFLKSSNYGASVASEMSGTQYGLGYRILSASVTYDAGVMIAALLLLGALCALADLGLSVALAKRTWVE